MTIQANELHIGESISASTLVHVADRRVTVNGKYHSTRKKLFEIPHLKASVGYFGLAQPTATDFFSSWLPNTICHGTGIGTLAEFAGYLEEELNKRVNKGLLRKNPSGFHLCGIASDGIPEFYFIRNIGKMDGVFYSDFRDQYFKTEDFRSRDAIRNEDGSSRKLEDLSNCIFWYVNGALRSFWSFWLPADQFVRSAITDPEFIGLESPGLRARWKLEAFASFYERFAKKKLIGKPIDLIQIR